MFSLVMRSRRPFLYGVTVTVVSGVKSIIISAPSPTSVMPIDLEPLSFTKVAVRPATIGNSGRSLLTTRAGIVSSMMCWCNVGYCTYPVSVQDSALSLKDIQNTLTRGRQLQCRRLMRLGYTCRLSLCLKLRCLSGFRLLFRRLQMLAGLQQRWFRKLVLCRCLLQQLRLFVPQ